ncbi:Dyp-type peroxidase [Rhizopogon vinicolor AM-OR11-026]|uniref:Dyp-type peroxidase n=1 Tax=Rhizopogon vinicolor AM-OR11-026 TaxID=1314800 RepID=A0A1B7N5Z0_9AGAM|nr:Dyp-type peroxidase [Rhizopogon vinicolor AM-OR11-026]
MDDIINRSHDTFTHFRRRGMVPLVTDGPAPFPRHRDDVPDPANVQGDIVYLFPKVAENFIFFRISHATQFRKDLATFNPTHGKQVYENLEAIHEAKARKGPRVNIVQKQIAFSRRGLTILGLTEKTGDNRFDVYAMRDNKKFLGDGMQWDPVFDKPNSDPVNGTANEDIGAIHGVITIVGSDDKVCEDATNATLTHFQGAIEPHNVVVLRGRTRPDQFKGHEHFGYQDGISQPAMRKLIAPLPGQIQVDAGVIIAGYKGDPALERRPKWVKDGSFMAFRKLEQLVPEFEGYVFKNGKRWREFVPKVDANPPLSDGEGASLWGARMFGRYRSGAPLARTPVRDDKVMAANPLENNKFDYTVPNYDGPTDIHCPFTAHTRKTAPRNLDPYLSKRFLEAGSIVRAGLPYGPEVTDAENTSGTSSEEENLKRGLLFVCYQSDLDSGFVRQTVGYANNDFFPTVSLIPDHHGQDPILGGPPAPVHAAAQTPIPAAQPGDAVTVIVQGQDEQQLEVSGFASPSYAGGQSPPGIPQEFFVNSRGGEYFFVPSISTLKDISIGPRR